MTDIVDRLISLYVQHGTNYVQEAADEIERLRSDNGTLRAHIKTQAEEAAKLMTQRDALRTVLDALCLRIDNEGASPLDWSEYDAALTLIYQDANK